MILESRMFPKRFFDLRSEEDMKVVKHFFQKSSWGKKPCPFLLEYPYTNIPEMVKDKIVYNTFGIKQNWS